MGDKKGQATVCMQPVDEHFWTCAEIREKWFLSFNPSFILSLLLSPFLSAYISWTFPTFQVLPGAGATVIGKGMHLAFMGHVHSGVVDL